MALWSISERFHRFSPSPSHTHTHSALDCYRVGRLAYEEKNWKKARDWMKEALHKFEDGK